MIEKFLKAKHWQLFVLTFVVPMVIQFCFMVGLVFTMTENSDPDFQSLPILFILVPVVMFLFTAVLYGWMWSVGVGMNERMPEEYRLNTRYFKWAFIFPIVYMLVIMIVLTVVFNDVLSGGMPNPAMFVLVLPFHFLAMLCSLYCLYFIGKTIKTAVFKREVKFGDFVGEIFLVWFFPLGIWFLQPVINRWYDDFENFRQ